MSLDRDLKANGTANATTEAIKATELEVREIEARVVLTEEKSALPPHLLEAEDVSELLENLAGADAVAEGMEGKLDRILENLDNLLAVLDSSVRLSDDAETASDRPNTSNDVRSSSSGSSSESRSGGP